MATKLPSEQMIARTWDRCLNAFVINTGVGAGVGIILSAFLFKRRAAPVFFTTGFAMGMAQMQCQFEFAYPELFHGRWQKTVQARNATAASSASMASAPPAATSAGIVAGASASEAQAAVESSPGAFASSLQTSHVPNAPVVVSGQDEDVAIVIAPPTVNPLTSAAAASASSSVPADVAVHINAPESLIED